MKMRNAIKMIVLFTVLLLPLKSFGAGNLNLIYVTSVYADQKGNGMRLPEGVACNGKGEVVVADSGNGRLLKFTFLNEALQGGSGIKVPQLSYPVRVQLNSKGEIFALDEKQRRIVRLSPEGAFEGFVEPAGIPAPDMVVPRSFKIDSITDRIYVCDIFGARVLVLDPAGKFVRQIPFPEGYGFISDLAVDPGGTVYLLDSVRAMIYTAAGDATAFTPLTKEMKEFMDFPVSIALDSRGVMYVVDRNGGDVAIIGRDGFQGRLLQRGWKEGLLYYPSQLCINDKGYVFIADRNNSRVQIFSILK